MKRKVKSYFAFTTISYRIIGLVLIPLLLLISSVGMLWHSYHEGSFYQQILLYNYVLSFEIIADYWVLGGCFSDKGRHLRYFKTSLKGVEVMGNVTRVDLMRKFLYCMFFAVAVFVLTGQKIEIVNGLAVYCTIVGILHGTRHIDGIQRMVGIGFLAQIPLAIINALNNCLILYTGVNEWIMLTCLTIIYGVTAVAVSRLMVRRITACICQPEKEERE